MQDFLVFDHVTKRFGDSLAVNDVSFGVSAGEIFSLLGPSGCGKTTLLRMVAGFIAPDEGRILLEGRDIAGLPPEQRPVNTVFQNYALFPHMTVRDNIGFGLRMARRAKPDIAREVDRALDLVGLRDHGDKRPTQLSGGQRQRVAIARALVNRPRVLLLDEPLAALDLKLRQRLLVELDAIHDEVGTTFLYVTHDQGEAMSISDHIAVMWDGRVEQIGTPPQIYEAPDNSFVAAFIGDTNFIKGRAAAATDSEHSRMDANGLGSLLVYNDRSLAVGERVVLSVRPEKIAISATQPPDSAFANTVVGKVEDVIYLGAQTRFGVSAGGMRFIVEFPHRRYLLDTKVPTWGDHVWLTWHADDGYLLREYDEEDQNLLSLASTEEN